MINMVGFDLETTGVDPETARIVAAAIVTRDTEQTWLVAQPDIPAESTAVHGIATWVSTTFGVDEVDAVRDIINSIYYRMGTGMPLVGMNLAYDLTILDRRATALGVPTLCRRLNNRALTGLYQPESFHVCPAPVLDAYVLDKMNDPYRKGRRTLSHLYQHYTGRELVGAHDPVADVRASMSIVDAQLETMGGGLPHLLHDRQREARRSQQENLYRYFVRSGVQEPHTDPCWPVCHRDTDPTVCALPHVDRGTPTPVGWDALGEPAPKTAPSWADL